MIPQKKPDPFDPWAHVEQRRGPAANDADYNDDGKTEGNWTMLLASVCGIAAIAVVLGAVAFGVGAFLYKHSDALLAFFMSGWALYSQGIAAAIGLAISIFGARWLRARRLRREAMQRYLETTITGVVK